MSGAAAGKALEAYLNISTTEDEIPPMPNAVAGSLRRCFQPDPAARPNDLLEVADIFQEDYRV